MPPTPDEPSSRFQFADSKFAAPQYAPRSRIYETLPAMLLQDDDLFGYQARANAPRNKHGWWILTGTDVGSRSPTTSASSASYDYYWTGLSSGADFALKNEDVIGLSLRRNLGKAKVSRGGEIKAAATIVGMSHTHGMHASYVDMGVSATRYKGDLMSSTRGTLASGVSGSGYSL